MITKCKSTDRQLGEYLGTGKEREEEEHGMFSI